jgi:hypothetical protein
MDKIEIIKLTIEVLAFVATAVAAIVAYRQFMSEVKRQSKDEEAQSKTLQLTFFAEYTKRYQEIILNLPENLDDESILDDKEEKAKRYLRVYFDLCGEEYFLHTKIIDREVWGEWEQGMKATFNKKAVLKYWRSIEKSSYSDFDKFVNEVLIKNSNK